MYNGYIVVTAFNDYRPTKHMNFVSDYAIILQMVRIKITLRIAFHDRNTIIRHRSMVLA